MPPRSRRKQDRVRKLVLEPYEGVLQDLPILPDLRKLVLRGPAHPDGRPGLRTLDGLPGRTTLRALRLDRCRDLSDLSALRSYTALLQVDLRGIPARDLRPLGHVEWLRLDGVLAMPRMRSCHGVRRLTILRSPHLTTVPPDRLPPGLTHLRFLGCPSLGSGGVQDLACVAALRDLRVLDLRGCGGLPDALRRVFLGAEIGVLLRGDPVPPAVQKRLAHVGNVERVPFPLLRHPRRLRGRGARPRARSGPRPTATTLRTFQTYGYADLERAAAAVLHPVPTLQFREDMLALDRLQAAFEDWERCARAAVVRGIHEIKAEDVEDLVQIALMRMVDSARKHPDWRFDQAAQYAGIRTVQGFNKTVGMYSWNEYVRQHAAGRAALRFGRPWAKKDRDAPEPAWRAVHGDKGVGAGPVATERLDAPLASPDRGVLFARAGDGWRGTLQHLEAPAEIVGFALFAVAPMWLPPRIAGRQQVAQDLALRTLAALQPVSGVRTHTRHAELPLSLGVPAADLADPHLAALAWATLPEDERAGADAARQRAADAVARTLARATEAERAAWHEAVARERAAAEGGIADEATRDALESAWLAVLGATTTDAQAKAIRQDAMKGAQKVLVNRRVTDLGCALLGQPVSEDIGPDTWDTATLRALLAWCDAWARSAAFWQGVRLRRPAALADDLDVRVAAARANPDAAGMRELLVLAGLLHRRQAVGHDRGVQKLLDDARACVDAGGGPERVWAACMGRAHGAASPEPVAVILDAEEHLAAAAWLDLPSAENAVLEHVAATMHAADARARHRARRALLLTRARFPADSNRAVSRRVARIVAGLESLDLPPALAVVLGLPVVLQADSAAYAEGALLDHPEAPVRLGWRGAARRAWLLGDRLQLQGSGWSVEGLALSVHHAGAPAEHSDTRLPPGAWTLRHADGVEIHILVRA